MRVYVYLRAEGILSVDSIFDKVTSLLGFRVPKNRILIEDVKVNIPLKYRQKLLYLINYSLEKDDTLVIIGLDSLGSSFAEIYECVNFIFEKGYRLICLDYSTKEMNKESRDYFIKFLKVSINFEDKKFTNIKNVNIVSNKVGRPEILNLVQKKEILEKFKKGQSVYSLAKQYSVTRPVIQRVLAKSEAKLNGE